MNSENSNTEYGDDPILDACLSEVLGGHGPPDIASRIVGSDGQLIADSPERRLASAPELPPVVACAPAIDVLERIVPNRKSIKQRDRWSITAVLAVAAGFAGVIVAIGFTARSRSPQPKMAKTVAPPKSVTASGIAKTVRQPASSEHFAAAPPTKTTASEPTPPAPATPTIAEIAPSLDNNQTAQNQTAQNSTAPLSPTHVTEPPPAIAQMPALHRQSSDDGTVVAFINNQLAKSWQEAGVRPSVVIPEAEWCQRVFSRVLGRAATSDEARAFADDKSAGRREKLIHRLLTDKKYGGEFASHWSAILAQAFLGRGALSANSGASRDELQKYFVSALSKNRSYSQIVTDLLTATGSPRAGAEDYNPAVQFLVDGLNGEAISATARVSRVLLGHQLQCAQCHQHPSQGWSQDQFWGLNACLRQVRIEQRDGATRLVRAGRTAGTRITYSTPDGNTKTASPKFIDGSEIAPSDDAGEANVLSSLAQKIIQSDDFSRATANRIWAQIFDYGFTRPLDDLGPNLSAAESAVLDRLAAEFAGHDFDLSALIRWAVLSEPFSRSSKLTDLASKDMPEEGERALFSRFYSRPTRSTDALASLAQVARIRSSGSSEREMERARIDWLAQANRTSAKASAKKSPVLDNPSIVVIGGDPIQRPASGDPSGLVKKLAGSQMSFDRKTEHLFLAGLGRQPTPRERRMAGELLRTAGGSEPIALEDLWWSLQNCSECIFDR